MYLQEQIENIIGMVAYQRFRLYTKVMVDRKRIDELRPLMDAISPTFCMAKWHHTTIYLQTGETHSCYHPAPHKIDEKRIGWDPSALHNTEEKKAERRALLNGRRPTACQYCWNIENLDKDLISDRHIRNSSIFRQDRYDEIKAKGADFPVAPEYIEVSFGNECNFKCGYCHPKASSKFYNEIRDHGPYDMVTNHRCDIDWMTIFEEESNPFVDAWWKWWPSVRSSVNILRITGGEPLLHKSTWTLLDDLSNNPMPTLELNINSNLGVKPILVTRLANRIKDLIERKCIKDFTLFTSIDTWGPQAAYIRTGLDLNLWEQNLDTYMTLSGQSVSMMMTYNVLSVPRFKLLLAKMLEWRKQYAPPTAEQRRTMRNVRFDTPYLREPLQYDINILPKAEFLPYLHECLAFMEANEDDMDKDLFGSLEVDKFRRVVRYMETTNYSSDKLYTGRRDFYAWFTEHDKRRNTNFVDTFPELVDFYNECGTIQ